MEAEARERHAAELTVFNNNGSTSGERVAGVAMEAEAHGRVVADLALGVEATGAGTRVAALVVDTGAVPRAVGVEHTLGAAPGPRVTEVPGRTGTGPSAVAHLAHSVGPTGRRHTGIPWWRYRHVGHGHAVH